MPEQVAALLLQWREEKFTDETKTMLKTMAAKVRGSSMQDHFTSAADLKAQIIVAHRLFPRFKLPVSDDSEQIEAYLGKVAAKLRIGSRDFAHRPNRKRRKKLKVAEGHRAYNKRLRFYFRMRGKYRRWLRNREIFMLGQISKTRLARFIAEKDFMRDEATASFIAYFTATLARRSLFTFGPQPKAYDKIADALLRELDAKKTSWFAVAHVLDRPEIFAKLIDKQRGRIMGRWYSIMQSSSVILDGLASSQEIDTENLIVRSGNDSSTWNLAAGAFNKARDGWIGAIHASGLTGIFKSFLPPKCLRLMAADVVRMHQHYRTGEDDPLEKDTLVWRELPRPWNVVLGKARCTLRMIEKAIKKHGIEGKGWLGPRKKAVAEVTPTPELVHGVIVSSPELATTLKKAGYFSAKKIKFAVSVGRYLDEHFKTIGAVEGWSEKGMHEKSRSRN